MVGVHRDKAVPVAWASAGRHLRVAIHSLTNHLESADR